MFDAIREAKETTREVLVLQGHLIQVKLKKTLTILSTYD
jgi:hypothetical protein